MTRLAAGNQTGVIEGEEMHGMTSKYLAYSTRRLIAISVALFTGLVGFAASAQAAPKLRVEIEQKPIEPGIVIPDRTTLVRGDGRIDYVVDVSNIASPNPAAGATLTCQPGGWTPASGASAPTFSYQWLRDGTAIGGATGQTYVLQATDQTHAVQCQVLATNSAAASVGVSDVTIVSPAPASVPPTQPTSSSARPTVTGAETAMRTCSAPSGWTGSPSFSFQWLRNGVAIPGATGNTYTPVVGVGQPDQDKILQCQVTGVNPGGAAVGVSSNSVVGTVVDPPASSTVSGRPSLTTSDSLTGTTSVSFNFPEGVTFADSTFASAAWSCEASVATCTIAASVAPGGALPPLDVKAWIDPERVPDVISTAVTAYGGGATSAIASHSVTLGAPLPFALATLTAAALDPLGNDYTQAGGHPDSATSSFYTHTLVAPNDTNGTDSSVPMVVEALRNIFTDLPVGFVGNPESITSTCTVAQVKTETCSASAAVGGVYVKFSSFVFAAVPLYRLVPEEGYPATFAFRPINISQLTIVIRTKLRSHGDYGVTAVAPLPPQSPEPIGVEYATLCSYGADVTEGGSTRFLGCKQQGDSGSYETPLLTNPTECAATGPKTTVTIDSFENRGIQTPDGFPDLSDDRWKSRSVESPLTTGCDQVPFDPDMAVKPTSTGRDSASGLDVDLDIPQDGLLDPDGIATSHLKKTVVELPEGLTVNPSAATGLEGCSDGQMAQHRLSAPNCPDGSKLGDVKVTSPLVDQPLRGSMYLATPKSTDPASGEMLRLWLVVRNDELGVSAKLPGSAVADPQTGRLTATFDDNPRLPFDHLEVDLKGGSRGVLATPTDCGLASVKSTLSPWSGTVPVARTTDTQVGGDCAEKFAPRLSAGNSDNQGRGQGGTYSFKFSREDGEQWLRGLTAKLPEGLLAAVRDVPLCSNGAADAGNCPDASKIGVVDAKAGVGDPFVLEQKGEVFLTEGYKGGEYGLAVKIRPVAGPFRGDMELSPIVVRQAIHVDRATARVTAISDPFPLIHHGIPLRTREVTVLVNRSGFMVNPSDCGPKQSEASLVSDEGATADLSDPFQVSGCAGLAFKPKLTLALTGRGQTRTGKHPGINAQVTQQGVSEAGIAKAVVRLPKSLALDVNNAQALCEFTDGIKPDLENRCPKGSIVGRARAKTPLLKDDLVGNVYFVKNIRIDPKTGNQIRTLPMIIVALRGEIAINLKGESSTTNSGKLVNTFASVPDAPISQFNLNIKGGNNGIIAVTRTRKAKINLCAGRHIAQADMDGHNGRRHDFDIRMKTPCTKKQTKNAKRAAAKARKAARRP